MAPEEDLGRAARFVASEWLQADVNEHPDIERLVAFQEGRLSARESDQIAEHVGQCVECSRDLGEIATFDEPVEADPDVRDLDFIDEDWAEFQRRSAGQGAAAEEGDGDRAASPALVRRFDLSHLSVAASVAVAVIALSVLLAPKEEIRGIDRIASARPLLFDLIPDAERSSRAASRHDIRVGADVDVLAPRLHIGDLASYDSYRVEILDSAGEIAWQADGLARQPAGQFLLLIPRRELPPDQYSLELFAVVNGEDRRLAQYSFVLYNDSN